MKTVLDKLLLIVVALFLHQPAFAAPPSDIYLVPSMGHSFRDYYDRVLTLHFDAGPQPDTELFPTLYYTYDSTGLSATAIADDDGSMAALYMVLSDLTFIDESGSETYCSGYAYFSGSGCPNALGYFTMNDIPAIAGESVLLVPIAAMVPEPAISALTLVGGVGLMGLSLARRKRTPL